MGAAAGESALTRSAGVRRQWRWRNRYGRRFTEVGRLRMGNGASLKVQDCTPMATAACYPSRRIGFFDFENEIIIYLDFQ